MRTAKVFKSDNSMAIRLPKDIQFSGNEVEIIKRSNEVILRDKPKNLAEAFECLAAMSNDFFGQERIDLPPEERERF